MNARERANAIASKWKNRTVWIGDLSADIEKAIITAEEEATKKERARCLELIKRCAKMYERLSSEERQSVIDIGKPASDPFSPFYRNSAEQTYSDRAMGCEYAEMVVREVGLDSNRMPLPF